MGLPNQVRLLTTQKSTLERENVARKESSFNQDAGNVGRWWTPRLPKTTSEILLAMGVLKGRTGVISVNH